MKTGAILLIEDNMADAGLVREALSEYRVTCELTIIPDGDRAIRYLQRLDELEACCPSLVIVDLNLPKRSGREVLQHLRQSACARQAIIIVLSSSDAPQDRADALQLGASHYIRKPLHLTEFLSLGSIFKSLLEASVKKQS